ncbi:MAG: DUF484 family protein [Acidiferrobacterales bacterium]|nr:DUF484 family protein [Acidiferrobacterales bacterium]
MLKPEDIATYLEENPAFFDQHRDLLATLQLSADDAPFHQRQVEVLRTRHSEEQAKYELVVDSARKNQTLEQQLHALSQELLKHPVHSVYRATETIEQHFDLPHVAIFREQDQDRNAAEDVHFELLTKRVIHGNSICDDRVSTTLLDWMFRDSGVASCAFVPLLSHGQNGVLTLGDADKERFQPGMGTVYLDRIGELISAYLCGCP